MNEHAEAYLLSRPTCPQYARQIRSRTKLFTTWLDGRQPTARLLNEYLTALEQRGLKPETVRGYRTSLLAVLRFSGWSPETPVRHVRMRDKQVDCFSLEELRLLVKTAEKMDGSLPNGLAYREFWPLAIRSGYATGLRYGDLFDVPSRSIQGDGVCHVVQSKTGRGVTVKFPAEALRLIKRHGLDKAIPWPYSGNQFRIEFKALLIASGVRRGSWKWLRRSAGTYMEAAKPGFGHKLLGNAADIFRQHYWAFKLLNPGPISPPEL